MRTTKSKPSTASTEKNITNNQKIKIPAGCTIIHDKVEIEAGTVLSRSDMKILAQILGEQEE